MGDVFIDLFVLLKWCGSWLARAQVHARRLGMIFKVSFYGVLDVFDFSRLATVY